MTMNKRRTRKVLRLFVLFWVGSNQMSEVFSRQRQPSQSPITGFGFGFPTQKQTKISSNNEIARNPFFASEESFTSMEDIDDKEKGWKIGNMIGSIGLVTGTTVGGGFLGLPFYTAKIGLFKSNILLIFTWIFLNIQAFVLIDLCLNCMIREKVSNVSIYTITHKCLGSKAAQFLSLCFFFLLNATLVSQISKAGNILSSISPLSSTSGSVFTALVVSVLVFLSKGSVIEIINSALTFGLLAAFSTLIIKGTPLMSMENLIASCSSNLNFSQCILAFPVLLQLLVFQEIIPTLCTRLRGNSKKIKKSVVIGSLIPLIMMLAWNTLASGLVQPDSAMDPLDVLLRSRSVGFIVSSLAFTAIVTTTIGGYLALEQFIKDILSGPTAKDLTVVREEGFLPQSSTTPENKAPVPVKEQSTSQKTSIYALTVLPSLLLSMFGPGAFYAAVEFAGAYPVTILYCISPPLMVLVNRYKSKDCNFLKEEASLIALIICSIIPLSMNLQYHLTAVVCSLSKLLKI